MPSRIPLDPKLPKAFDATPNEARSKAQLDQWWDRPTASPVRMVASRFGA